MGGTDDTDQPDQPDDLETNLADLYDLAIVCFDRGEYGLTLQVLSQISKLRPSFDDREDLRNRVAIALDQQQRDLVFDSARTEAEQALQQHRWDDIPEIITAMERRLVTENLTLNDEQRAESNRWTLKARRGGRPRRKPQQGRRLFKPTTLQPPASARPNNQVNTTPTNLRSGNQAKSKPGVSLRLGETSRNLMNAVRGYVNDRAWIPVAFAILVVLTLVLIR